MDKEKEIIDKFEDEFNKMLEEQIQTLLKKYPSLKLQEFELREKMKEELKKQFLLMKENPNFDSLEPDEKTLNEIISKVPLIYNETVLIYKFIYDYIEEKSIQYNYYQELKEFYKTINDMKYNKELTLGSLFEGSNKINEVMLNATNSKDETNIFQELIWALDEYTQDNQLTDATNFILKIANDYPSILKMKIHKFLKTNAEKPKQILKKKLIR